MMKYNPIETAPKDGKFIDLWAGNNRIADIFWDKFNERWEGSEQLLEYTPTHWTLIPEGPYRS
jgi:hypothetical protein